MADFVSFFVWLFKDIVMWIVLDNVNSSVPPLIVKAINTDLLATDGYAQMTDSGLMFDFALDRAPLIVENGGVDQLQLFLNGSFFNKSYGEIEAIQGRANMTIDPSTKDDVQFDLSANAVDSIYRTLFETNDLWIMLNQSMIPAGIPFNLTTTYFELILKGIVEKYGKDKPMTVKVKVHDPPTCQF